MTSSPTNPGRVLVTGGGSGLGAAVVDAVRRAGGTPIVFDIAPGDEEQGVYQVDVSDTPAVQAAVERAVERFGGLDAVVTAAGIDAPGRLGDIDWQTWEKVVKVDLIGTVATVRSALPALKASGGKVVTIASTLGLKAVSDATAYNAAKFGVVGFTRSLAVELKGEIGVTLLIPAGMKTKFFDGRTEQYKPKDDSRLQEPETVADTILFVLGMPSSSVIRELAIMHPEEDSWP